MSAQQKVIKTKVGLLKLACRGRVG